MTRTHPAELNNGVWTSWLPVTTAWPSSPACSTAAWARYGLQPSNNFWPYIFDPAYGQSVANTPRCLPPQATSWWDGAVTSTGTVTSYSMGPVVCPEAYSTVSTSVVEGSSTSIICCPSNFDFARGVTENSGIDGVCTSVITSGMELSYANTAADGTENSYTPTETTFTATGLLIAVPVEGYNFAASTTSSSSSATTSAATITGTNGADTSSSGAAVPTNVHKSGLSTGAKAGIGAGVAGIAILAAVVLAILLFRKRRRAQEVKYVPAPNELPPDDRAAELPAGKSEVSVQQTEPQEMYQRTLEEENHAFGRAELPTSVTPR